MKILLADTIDFTLIVECKNRSRPLDRPVVQKLAQTRDAVAAHKAAIVSPIGFTKEAIEVAKANGIALWVISKARWDVVLGAMEPSALSWIPLAKRRALTEQLGLMAELDRKQR